MAKGDKARTDILDAARRLFLSKGYASTSMRDIASEAGGRAVAGIYNHFPSKQAVFQALINEHMPSVELITILASLDGTSARDLLGKVVRTALPLLKTYDAFFELALIDLREFGGENIHHLIQTIAMPSAMSIVQKAMSFPDLRPIDPIALLRMAVSLAFGYILTNRIAPRVILDHLSDQAWIDAYAAMLIHGLCTDPD